MFIQQPASELFLFPWYCFVLVLLFFFPSFVHPYLEVFLQCCKVKWFCNNFVATFQSNHIYNKSLWSERNKRTSLVRINKFLGQNLTLLHMHTFVGQIDLNLFFFSIIKLVNLSSSCLLFTNLSSPRPHFWPCDFVINSKFGI